MASGRRLLRDNAVPSVFPFKKQVVSRPPPARYLKPRNEDCVTGTACDTSEPQTSEDMLESVCSPTNKSHTDATNTFQEASCCSCQQELLATQQQLKEKEEVLVRLQEQLAQTSSKLNGKSEECIQLQKQCTEYQRCHDTLMQERMSLARAKEAVVSLTRKCEDQKKDHDKEMHELSSKLSKANEARWIFGIDKFQNDDSSIQFYTGLPNYGHFKALVNVVNSRSRGASSCPGKEETRGRRCKLSQENQIFLTLIKLRVGCFHLHLSHIFDISLSAVSRIFSAWVRKLYETLTDMPWWSTRDIVDSTMPEAFRQKYPATRVIIDATEVRCEASSSLVIQSGTYSNYKSANTFKGLIGIQPNGLISFVSDLFTGCISDRELVIRSGLLKQAFDQGDTIMADKGFKIKDLLDNIGVGLNLPPFLTKGQFSAAEVEETADIASLRIHVERRIQRIKTFHIFDRVIPLSLAPIASQIWVVCALLSNLQTTILKEYE